MGGSPGCGEVVRARPSPVRVGAKRRFCQVVWVESTREVSIAGQPEGCFFDSRGSLRLLGWFWASVGDSRVLGARTASRSIVETASRKLTRRSAITSSIVLKFRRQRKQRARLVRGFIAVAKPWHSGQRNWVRTPCFRVGIESSRTSFEIATALRRVRRCSAAMLLMASPSLT